MAITLQRLIDTAVLISGVESPGVDTITNVLLPRVVYRVTDKLAARADTRHLVTLRESLASLNGVLTPTSTIMLKYLKFAALENVAIGPPFTFSNSMRWVDSWQEFTRPQDSTLGYFIGIQVGGVPKIVFTSPGSSYIPTGGDNVTIDLTAVHMPVVPTLIGNSLSTPPEVENEMIIGLAQALKDPGILLLPVEVEETE